MLHEQIPFSLEGRTKAARGYGLLAGKAPTVVKGRLRGPKPGESIRAAFVAAMRAGLDHLRANEAAVLAAVDPEGVHQMRVALRRLRGIVSAFASILVPPARTTLRAELKWLQGCLGPARDWDVFIADWVQPSYQFPSKVGGGALDYESLSRKYRKFWNSPDRTADYVPGGDDPYEGLKSSVKADVHKVKRTIRDLYKKLRGK